MIGKYICIEGPDGGGKSTLVRCLEQRLQADRVPVLRRWFPSDNVVGSMIRSGLRGEVELNQQAYLYLFCADGLQANQQIHENLVLGRHIVCDRHPTLSGRVFQVDHHSPEQVEAVYDWATIDGVIAPDHLFVLDIPPEVSLERMRNREKYKDVVFETEDIQKVAELRRRYLVLADRYKATVLDGTLKPDELVAQVLTIAGL